MRQSIQVVPDKDNTGNLPWIADYVVVNNPGSEWIYFPQLKKWIPPTYMNVVLKWGITPPTYEIAIGSAVASDGQTATPTGAPSGGPISVAPQIQFISQEPMSENPGQPYGVIINAGSVTINGTSSVSIVGTPTVTISGTPTVNISNTPSVIISGTPTVNINAGQVVQVQNTSGGSITIAGTINIGNTPSVVISGGVTISNITAGTVSISGNVTIVTPSTYANLNAVRIYGLVCDLIQNNSPAAGTRATLTAGPFSGDINMVFKVTWACFNASGAAGACNARISYGSGGTQWRNPITNPGSTNNANYFKEDFEHPICSRAQGDSTTCDFDSAIAGCAQYVSVESVTFFTGP